MKKLGLALLFSFSAVAYVRYTTAGGTPLFRPDVSNIQFLVHNSIAAGATNADAQVDITATSNPLAALTAAINTWSSVPTSRIHFAPLQSSSIHNVLGDGKNTITIEDTSSNRSVVGSFLAITVFQFNNDGSLIDSDIIFNPKIVEGTTQVPFSTDHANGTYDVQSVTTHELGHALGANHSGLISATMFPNIFEFSQFITVPEATIASTLSPDDIAFAATAYPAAGSTSQLGEITGTVSLQSGGGVKGALVAAIDPSIGIAVGGLTSLVDGSYTIAQVPPGHYQVYAHPLNGPVTPPNVQVSGANTTFRTTFAGGNATPSSITVTGGSISPANITVDPALTAMSIAFIGLGPVGTSGFSFFAGPNATPAGAPVNVYVWGQGFNASTPIRLLGPGMSIRAGTIQNVPSAISNGMVPVRFTVDIAPSVARDITTIAFVNGTDAAVYSGGLVLLGSGPQTMMALSRSALNFGVNSGQITGPQSVGVTFSGGPGLAWSATSNQPSITVSPFNGTGNGSFVVTATNGPSGVVTVTTPGASNSPQQVQVNIAQATAATPFGSFDTPANNTSGIAGAIPVTGWALDNVEVLKTDIWREPIGSEPVSANGLVYIGDAVFVNDARPDVAAAYPTVPFNYRAGWGYLLLTNFLPANPASAGLGNGTYKLHAIAHDREGLSTDLGARTIIVDNAHASKPFGTIDTPGQGATISGASYVNFGWALTQNPNVIPMDGSTITVSIDGVTLGHPTYNQFRSDIATAFPGRANSGGAVGYFILDTTKLTNGVHTIGWVVYDNVGHGDGIGSRFFNVSNSSSPAAGSDAPAVEIAAEPALRQLSVEELDLIEVPVNAASGYMLANDEQVPLPAGSTLRDGVLYWQLAPGFLGDYELVLGSTRLRVHVRPKKFSQSQL